MVVYIALVQVFMIYFLVEGQLYQILLYSSQDLSIYTSISLIGYYNDLDLAYTMFLMIMIVCHNQNLNISFMILS